MNQIEQKGKQGGTCFALFTCSLIHKGSRVWILHPRVSFKRSKHTTFKAKWNWRISPILVTTYQASIAPIMSHPHLSSPDDVTKTGCRSIAVKLPRGGGTFSVVGSGAHTWYNTKQNIIHSYDICYILYH